MAEPTFALQSWTATDGYRWQYRRYPPAGIPRGQVVCLHGIQSHAGWYDYSCARLSLAGYKVFFLDRRGSGQNQQERGDTPSFRRLLDDVAEFLMSLQAERRTAPLFLLGISWGGKLAAALPYHSRGLIDGLVLICPGFCPRVRPPWTQRLAIAWARLARPRRMFPIPLNDPELFTATPRWQEFIRTDPLALRQATARLLVESVRLDRYLRRAQTYVQVPVLLLLAERDRIIDNRGTRNFVARFASTDKTVAEYAQAHHTLEFEPEPDRFVDDLLRWLDEHQLARDSRL